MFFEIEPQQTNFFKKYVCGFKTKVLLKQTNNNYKPLQKIKNKKKRLYKNFVKKYISLIINKLKIFKNFVHNLTSSLL